MNTAALRETLSKGVGKQILVLFLIAAIVPMVFTAGMAHREFNRELREETADSLNRHAKEYGHEILARLAYAGEKAEEFARVVEADGTMAMPSDDFLVGDFDAIWLALARGDRLTGSPKHPNIPRSSLNHEHLSDGKTQFVLSDDNDLILLRSIMLGDDERYIAFELAAERLWGDREALTLTAEYCVFTVERYPLHCTSPIGTPLDLALRDTATSTTENTFLEWQLNGEPRYAARWHLFLASLFGSEPLAIVVVQDKGFAMQAGAEFRRIFFPSVVLVLLLVGVLSLSFISRSLGPLGKLTGSARQIAAGNFATRVIVRTGDEFEKLADAFNNMASRIGQQIAALEALSGIDQMILTGADLDRVSEQVVTDVMEMTDCDAAAAISHDPDAPGMGKMVSASVGGETQTARIGLPREMDASSHTATQLAHSTIAVDAAPYAARFQSLGRPYVVTVPVLTQGEPTGLLVLGFPADTQISTGDRQRCLDLAARFAVALASVEREEALYRQAHFDELTGLPNRQLMKDRLEQIIVKTRTDGDRGALLFLDLDRFKEVNDIYGHTVGDTVLCQASERISSVVRDGDTIARLGGDEFVVLLPSVTQDRVVHKIAESLLEKLRDGFSVRGIDHYLGASIGIAMIPYDGATVETLLQNADAAMYRAKDAGRNRFEFFSRSLNAESRRKVGLERDLRIAVSNGDLAVHYQPQLNLDTGELSGAEALVRWTHDKHGVVGPDEFIPLAEDSDLIVELGTLVIEKACGDLKEILGNGMQPGMISINVSARQLADSRFEHSVLGPIRRLDIGTHNIQLEITETTVAQNRDIAIEILESLREKGIRIALDDFGTGYSSLSYLQQMPFDSIKIDKSFIDGIGTGEAPDNICMTIIKMSEQLGKKSIAEGVEELPQLEFLARNGCDVVQGYYYSRPLPVDEFREFVKKQGVQTQRRKVTKIFQ